MASIARRRRRAARSTGRCNSLYCHESHAPSKNWGKLGGVIDFDAVWNRIRSHAGETFKTKTGLAFSYHVPGAYLRVDRNGHEIERSLSRTNFENAAAQLPAGGPGDLKDRPGRFLHLGHPDGSTHQTFRLVTCAACFELD